MRLRHTIRALGLALMAVVLAVTSAHAECAWVLWRQTLSGPNESWFPQEAYTNVSGCKTAETVENRVAERFRETTPPEKRLMPNFSYLCLPDTIDPRGPKTK